MDNRRVFAFLLLGISVFLLFNSRQESLRQAEIRRKEQQTKAIEAQARRKEKLADLQAKTQAELAQNPIVEPDRKRWVLGSMDPKAGYSLVVVLDNRGAGIERIEAVERLANGKLKYRSLQDNERRGYAGYLAIESRDSALFVQSITPGSPAALAKSKDDPTEGLQPGDKILQWKGLEGSPAIFKWQKWLESWRVGDTVPITVERQGKSLVYDVVLDEKPLDIVRAEDDFFAEQVLGNDPVLSCLTTLAKVDNLTIDAGESAILGLESTLEGNWDAKAIEVENGSGVEFVKPLKTALKIAGVEADLEIVKQYRLFRPDPKASETTRERWQFHVDLTTILRNKSDKTHSVAVRQEGVNGISLEGWWYPTKISPFFFSAAGARDIIVSDGFAPHTLVTTRSVVSHGLSDPNDSELELFGPANTAAKRSLNYIGLDTQAFTSAFLPGSETNSMKELERGNARVLNSVYKDSVKLSSYKQQACNVGFWFETQPETLGPNGEKKSHYVLFAGPKDPTLLAAYKLDEAVEYGWDIFGFFAKRLGWILHFFYGRVGNFGLAIMMLTVLVRSLMFPVSRKMAINAQKMQSLAPHTAKLKEAFKEDPRKMMAAQQMLMKKTGINQFAGCLPALIQLPIVIGLYRCVSVDVGLRQQALVPGWEWCSNLAGPDMLVEWHSWMPDFIAGRGTGYFGPYFNILPIITITLFILQQKILMPKATDEQTAIAQKMMMFMTVAMGVLFFRVPAGLCIYFITSSTWSLIERTLIKRFAPKGLAVDLPENTAMEIIQAVNKLGTAAAAQRPASNNSSSDKPREKMTKPPETLADLFPGWFGKKKEQGGGGTTGGSKSGNSNRSSSNGPRPKRPRKPK